MTSHSGLVFAPLDDRSSALVILDARRRVYAGLSRGGDYWHLISPSQYEIRDEDGNPTRNVGDLFCTCKGGTFRGTCYRTKEAEVFEGTEREAVQWMPRATVGATS